MLFVLCCAAAPFSGCAHRASRSGSAPSPQVSGADLTHGKAVYAQQCAACHGAGGKGGEIGPALVNERSKKSYDAVRAIVLDPQPPMPKLYPSVMTEADVRDVSAYVESL